MEKTTTEVTIEYIKEHPDIKSCLKKGLINYSSLSRMIAKELEIEKKTSKEAILISARRFREKIKKEEVYEHRIRELLSKSEIELRNKIIVFILDKDFNPDFIDGFQKKIRKESGTFFLLEGSGNYTLITQEKYEAIIEPKLKNSIIQKTKNLALVNFKSPKEIEHIYGVVAYITSLFAENGVNILEFLSCWTDTLFIIKAEDANKTLSFLRF